jgi:hypothetical protein
MHKRYAKDGLEVMAVSLDDPRDPSAREAAVGFLRTARAGFPTYVLTGGMNARPPEFAFQSIPCVFVFDRAGNPPRKFDGGFDFGDVERVVRDYLKH